MLFSGFEDSSLLPGLLLLELSSVGLELFPSSIELFELSSTEEFELLSSGFELLDSSCELLLFELSFSGNDSSIISEGPA